MAQWHGSDAPAGTIPQNYERYFVPAIGAPVANDLITRAALRPGERVLDVACGTGVVARMAANRVGASGVVAGLDINPGMLAVARTIEPDGVAIDWHEASAEQMPLAEASFDVVLCQMGLQFVPDKSTALAEMHRVLVPGGRLLLNAPGPTPELFDLLDAALSRHVDPAVSGFVHQVFSLHDTNVLQALVADAGFDDVAVSAVNLSLPLAPPAEFLWQYLTSTPLAAAVEGLGDGRREQLERDVVATWQPFVADGVLRLEVRLVTATGGRGSATR